MKDRFGLIISPCPKGEHYSCPYYRENTSCYCAEIYCIYFEAGILEPQMFACAKYPNLIHLEKESNNV